MAHVRSPGGAPDTYASWMGDASVVDEMMANAWPPQVVERVGSWRYRWASGVTRRANSVLAIREAGDVDELIARAERFYKSRDARRLFQVTTASTPRSLVGVLEARGYRPTARTLVSCTDAKVVVDSTMPAPGFVRRVDSQPTAGWFETYWSVEKTRGRAPGDDAICRDVLLRPVLPTSFVSVVDGQEVIGVGQVVVEHGWAGVQCMATPPAHRRRGAGSAVLNALAVEALARGAERMYLAVMADNAGARSLYERAGFRPAHDYCYYAAP